jgi:hypothetical protein
MKNLSASALDSKARVTCATMLVRIVKAPKSDDGLNILSRENFEEGEWEAKGLAVPAVEYSSGVYDTVRANPGGVEKTLYVRRPRAKQRGEGREE